MGNDPAYIRRQHAFGCCKNGAQSQEEYYIQSLGTKCSITVNEDFEKVCESRDGVQNRYF